MRATPTHIHSYNPTHTALYTFPRNTGALEQLSVSSASDSLSLQPLEPSYILLAVEIINYWSQDSYTKFLQPETSPQKLLSTPPHHQPSTTSSRPGIPLNIMNSRSGAGNI